MGAKISEDDIEKSTKAMLAFLHQIGVDYKSITIDSVKKVETGSKKLYKFVIKHQKDGVRVENIGDYSGIIEGKKADETAVLTIYRVTRNKGRELEIEVTIGDSRGIK